MQDRYFVPALSEKVIVKPSFEEITIYLESTQGNDLHMNYENIESVFHNVMYVEVLLLFLYLV